MKYHKETLLRSITRDVLILISRLGIVPPWGLHETSMLEKRKSTKEIQYRIQETKKIMNNKKVNKSLFYHSKNEDKIG